MNGEGLDLDRLNKARDTAEAKAPGAIRAAAKLPGKLGDDARSYIEGEKISANMECLGDQALANTSKQMMNGLETERAIAGGAVPTLGEGAGKGGGSKGLGQPGGGGLGRVPVGGALGSLGKPQRAAGKSKGLDMA